MGTILEVYHGSKYKIDHPYLGGGSAHNDFGSGFYVTQFKKLAHEWACSDGKDGIVNQYHLDTNGLNTLNFTSENYNILNWAATLLKYRKDEDTGPAEGSKKYLIDNFSVDIDSYDLIYAYRADDSYFRFTRLFLQNFLSLERLEKAMVAGNLGMQLVLKTQKAFDTISFLQAEPAKADLYIEPESNRFVLPHENEANRRVEALIPPTDQRPSDETYAYKIIQEGVTNNDPRLSKILSGCRHGKSW